MSGRPGFTISEIVPCDGGVSPNAYVPQITVEIRVHYPPRQIENVEAHLTRAFAKALAELDERVREHQEDIA